MKRPVTGRNALVEIEGEDYDGQSGVTKEDSNDSPPWDSRSPLASGGYVFYEVVDFSDAGVGAVQLRVNAQTATTLELRADSQTGTLLGTCQVAATGGCVGHADLHADADHGRSHAVRGRSAARCASTG